MSGPVTQLKRIKFEQSTRSKKTAYNMFIAASGAEQ